MSLFMILFWHSMKFTEGVYNDRFVQKIPILPPCVCVCVCVCVCQCKTSKMGFKLCNFAAEWVGVKKWGHFRGPIFSSTIILSSDYGNSQKIQNLRLSHFWHFFRFYTLRNFLSWISGHPLTFFLQYILATQNVYLCW